MKDKTRWVNRLMGELKNVYKLKALFMFEKQANNPCDDCGTELDKVGTVCSSCLEFREKLERQYIADNYEEVD